MGWRISKRGAALVLGALLFTGIPGVVAAQMAPMAGMIHRDLRVEVVKADGGSAGLEGLRVRLAVQAGRTVVKELSAYTDAAGIAVLEGVPANPRVQKSISYSLTVEYEGARFPYRLEGAPSKDARVQVKVQDIDRTPDATKLQASHVIDLMPDEDSLVARHQLWLVNPTDTAMAFSALPEGGLFLPLPEGAKHPQLQGTDPALAEFVGEELVIKGLLLPNKPVSLKMVYTLPYGNGTLEWKHTLPIPVERAEVWVAKGKHKGQQRAFPMKLATRGGLGELEDGTLMDGRKVGVLRATQANLSPGKPFVFAVSGLPKNSTLSRYAIVALSLGAIGLLLFGFKRQGNEAPQYSREHLVAERQRLVRALARMRRATERGRLSPKKYKREREAITARLISLYRALDRLDSR